MKTAILRGFRAGCLALLAARAERWATRRTPGPCIGAIEIRAPMRMDCASEVRREPHVNGVMARAQLRNETPAHERQRRERNCQNGYCFGGMT